MVFPPSQIVRSRFSAGTHITGIFAANICHVLKHASFDNRGSVLTLFTNEVKQDKRPLGHICIITGCCNYHVE
jgi:hypothetical protein